MHIYYYTHHVFLYSLCLLCLICLMCIINILVLKNFFVFRPQFFMFTGLFPVSYLYHKDPTLNGSRYVEYPWNATYMIPITYDPESKNSCHHTVPMPYDPAAINQVYDLGKMRIHIIQTQCIMRIMHILHPECMVWICA